jgi:hypothetical protein
VAYIGNRITGYRVTGLQDYRITGLQDYRITGLQDYRITGLQVTKGILILFVLLL